jgi:hypothetical protein
MFASVNPPARTETGTYSFSSCSLEYVTKSVCLPTSSGCKKNFDQVNVPKIKRACLVLDETDL